MNDFHDDDKWQREQRNLLLVPYYKTLAVSFTLADGDMSLQKRAIDTVLYFMDGTVLTVEEKIVRWPGYVYTAFTLETESCTVEGHEKIGWMRYGEAERLFYCFQREDLGLDCYSIDFQRLRAWFAPIEESFEPFQMETRNRTRGRKVPIVDVESAGLVKKRLQLDPLEKPKPKPVKKKDGVAQSTIDAFIWVRKYAPERLTGWLSEHPGFPVDAV